MAIAAIQRAKVRPQMANWPLRSSLISLAHKLRNAAPELRAKAGGKRSHPRAKYDQGTYGGCHTRCESCTRIAKAQRRLQNACGESCQHRRCNGRYTEVGCHEKRVTNKRDCRYKIRYNSTPNRYINFSLSLRNALTIAPACAIIVFNVELF